MEEYKKNLINIIETLKENELIFNFDIESVFKKEINLCELSQIVIRRFYENIIEEEIKKDDFKIPYELKALGYFIKENEDCPF